MITLFDIIIISVLNNIYTVGFLPCGPILTFLLHFLQKLESLALTYKQSGDRERGTLGSDAGPLAT